MGLEAATYLNDLVSSNPIGASDTKSFGDDHLRLIKAVLKATFPGMVAPLTIQLTDAGALQGPSWIMDRLSASPAIDDLIGGLIFRGRDSAAAVIDYTNIVGRIKDPVAGTTDSEIGLQVRVNGALTEILTIAGAGIAGVGSGLTALNASNLGSGTVPNARLAGSYTGVIGTGALNAGSITNGFGSIDVGADPITGGAGSFTTLAASAAATVGTTLGVTGIITGSNNIVANQNFASSTVTAVLGSSAAGTVNLRPNGVGSATGQLSVASTGNVTVAGDLTANSDRRFKKTIEELSVPKAVDAILHVNPVSYVRTANEEKGIGFIAQDVEQYYPELVHTDDEGYKSLAYANMTAVLWSAVKYLLQDKLAA